MERLDKFLGAHTPYTRSQLKPILKAGRVTVNGAPETDGSKKIDPTRDAVALDGELLEKRGPVVLMLNKPAGYVTAREDSLSPTVMELIPENYRHLDLSPVGRLDKATEGLLLLTDDGDLLHRLISPKNRVEKIYYARHEGTAGEADVATFREGLTLADGTKCLPATLTPIGPGESLVTVCEGKYHQVRRMLASRGLPVTYLERRQEGPLTLGDLPRGALRPLTAQEQESLGSF